MGCRGRIDTCYRNRRAILLVVGSAWCFVGLRRPEPPTPAGTVAFCKTQGWLELQNASSRINVRLRLPRPMVPTVDSAGLSASCQLAFGLRGAPGERQRAVVSNCPHGAVWCSAGITSVIARLGDSTTLTSPARHGDATVGAMRRTARCKRRSPSFRGRSIHATEAKRVGCYVSSSPP